MTWLWIGGVSTLLGLMALWMLTHDDFWEAR